MHRRKELASKCCVKTFAAIAVVLGMLLACMLISPKYAQAASYDLSGKEVGWVVGTGEQGSQVQFSTDGGKNWQNYTNGMTLDYGTQVRVKLSWKVPNEVKVQQGTTFTYDLPQGIAFENGATYPMYDSTGKQRGTFTVQDNKVVATYTDTTDASSGINAYVTIDGKITRSADNKGNGGERDWNFPGIGNVETTINPEHGLDIHKNGAVNTGETDADGNSVYYYVLNVGSTGPNTNVTITDTMGELLTLDSNSFELFTDAGLTTKYGKSDWTATPNTGGDGFTLTIPSMGDGEKLYVKYKVKVNRQQVIEACKATADATAQCENGNLDVTDNKVTIKSNKSTEKTDHKGLVFKSKWTVNKRGSADGDQHDINWNIELIPGDDSNTRNTMVKDLLGEGMEPPTGDVTIECYGKRQQVLARAEDGEDQVGGPGKRHGDIAGRLWPVRHHLHHADRERRFHNADDVHQHRGWQGRRRQQLQWHRHRDHRPYRRRHRQEDPVRRFCDIPHPMGDHVHREEGP